jgi:hypothetical protein
MRIRRLLLVATVLGFAFIRQTFAYIEAPHSFGQVVAQSTNILLMRVEAVDKEKNLIIYRKVRDIKGVHPTDVIKHSIGRGGLRPNEWKHTMDWAEPGKTAAFFYNSGGSETCIGNYWYQAYAGGEWWNHSHGEPFLLRTYCGAPEKLPALVAAVMEGREVVVTCMVDGANKEDLHKRSGKIQRLKASLKLQDYNQKRDFVGWGGEEFRRLQGMPGFTHITALARTDPDAQAISIADFDNDGKPDLCMVGGGRLVILQNAGETMSEIVLPGVSAARAAVWGDYNCDGLPDLLVTATAGLKLFTNLGNGNLRDDSHHLPKEPYAHWTAAAWADFDADGRPDLLLANGYHGLRVYRNIGVKPPQVPAQIKLGKWSYLGPVDFQVGRFEAPHPAEKLDLKATYDGKGGAKIQWKRGNFNDGAVNSVLELFPPKLRFWSGMYLHRTIETDRAAELPVSFGSDDTLTVWLDGKKIVSDGSHRGAAPDQNLATLKLTAGKHDLLMKICNGDGDFGFYFSAAKPDRPVPPGVAFEDISVAAGLGPDGPAADVKFDSLIVRDVNGDGRPDFLYGNRFFEAGPGKSAPFAEVKNAGLAFDPQKTSPVFGDFNGDGILDLFVPQKAAGKLYRSDGKGRFQDVSAKSGALAQPFGWASSAAWGDFDNDGHLDVIVGCFKAPNRFFRNKGDGSFEDATDKIGLGQRIFNSQAVACIDLNGDGQLDLVFNNEGQDSAVLLGSPGFTQSKRMPLTLRVQSKFGAAGSQVRVLNKSGKLLASQEVSGGDGRGSQQSPFVRFALDPGAYQVQVRLSNGATQTREFTIGESPIRGVIGDASTP